MPPPTFPVSECPFDITNVLPSKTFLGLVFWSSKYNSSLLTFVPRHSALLYGEVENLHGSVSASPKSEIAKTNLLLMNLYIQLQLFIRKDTSVYFSTCIFHKSMSQWYRVHRTCQLSIAIRDVGKLKPNVYWKCPDPAWMWAWLESASH